MKKLVTFLVVGVLVGTGRGTAAQELLVPPTGETVTGSSPAQLPSGGSTTRGYSELPDMELPAAPTAMPDPTNQNLMPEPIASGDLQSESSLNSGDDYRVFDCEPALLESTGTWLRRGFWYTQVDAVIMDRVWRRDNFLLMFQNNAGTGGTGVDNPLIIDGGTSGAEGMPRVKLGRFLFRDHKNRDHNLEFTAFGGGQWTRTGRLDAVNNGTLTVGSFVNSTNIVGQVFARLPMDQGNPSFDGATSTQYEYDSRLNSFELNYQVSSRMRRDRMEMEPSGHWVRRAQNSPTLELLAGIRYVDINEDFDWDAFDIDDPLTAAVESETGTYRVRTDNDLIGAQFGGSWTYESARWSLGLAVKNGLYWNHTNVENDFEITNISSGDNDIEVDNISFLVQGGLIGKWHLRPNFSLRSGFDVFYVSSLALAAEQMNFAPVSSAIVDDGSATYMGGSIGFEAYW